MVTYGDTITLLMTFFVLLMTFSTMEDETFSKLASAIGGTGRPGFFGRDAGASPQHRGVVHDAGLAAADATGIRRRPSEAEGALSDRPASAYHIEDHEDGRLIVLEADGLFAGERPTKNGERILKAVAGFLKTFPNPVVVRASGRAPAVAGRLAQGGVLADRLAVAGAEGEAATNRIELLVLEGRR
jgi:chemotaxis protein MotB